MMHHRTYAIPTHNQAPRLQEEHNDKSIWQYLSTALHLIYSWTVYLQSLPLKFSNHFRRGLWTSLPAGRTSAHLRFTLLSSMPCLISHLKPSYASFGETYLFFLLLECYRASDHSWNHTLIHTLRSQFLFFHPESQVDWIFRTRDGGLRDNTYNSNISTFAYIA
jgi:hypothetical protein